MKRIVVKPVKDKWGVFEMSALEDVIDDLFRYGIRVAMYNVIWYVKHSFKS